MWKLVSARPDLSEAPGNEDLKEKMSKSYEKPQENGLKQEEMMRRITKEKESKLRMIEAKVSKTRVLAVAVVQELSG